MPARPFDPQDSDRADTVGTAEDPVWAGLLAWADREKSGFGNGRTRAGLHRLVEFVSSAGRALTDGPLPDLVLWGPVAVMLGAALGCGVWAGWQQELTACGAVALLLLGASLKAMAGRRGSDLLAVLGFAVVLAGAGLTGTACALLEASARAAPVVEHSAIGAHDTQTVTGRVSEVDRARSGAWRVVIDVAGIEGLPSDSTPHRVRLTLRESEPPLPGQALACSARLNPPPGPVVPDAYDFSRAAWFRELGAVGYTLKKCEPVSLPAPSWPQQLQDALARARMAAAAALAGAGGPEGQNAADGAGGFLAAVATGDRSWLPVEDMEALQLSGLAHIVSVSGLHVGLVSGLTYLVIWRLLALVGWLAVRIDVRKPAALSALAAAFAYTVFTGSEAPAVRACVMAGVVFGAVLLDRRGVTRRSLALAALAILLVRPHSAVEPGFQMSFLATLALVSLWEGREGGGPTVLAMLRNPAGWVGASLLASFVAGAATAPVSGSVFHRVSPWGTVANLVATPVQDIVVAPFSLLAAVLSPLGWGDPFWAVARWGMGVTLDWAHVVAGWPGAGVAVPDPDWLPPVLLGAAIIWLCLSRTVLRWLGVPVLLAGLVLWALSPRVEGWIAPAGAAFLAHPPGTLARLCFAPGGRFEAMRLVDEAGLPPSQARALAPPPRARGDTACSAGGGDWEIHFIGTNGGKPLLALAIGGRLSVFEPGDLDGGATLARRDGRLEIRVGGSGPGPWVRSAQSALLVKSSPSASASADPLPVSAAGAVAD
jgi:competence protein ComEC